MLIPSFNFEHEIQKIKILVPLSELVKNKDFKRSLSKLLQSESPQPPSDSVNLQYEKPTVILGPMVEDRDDSSPPWTYMIKCCIIASWIQELPITLCPR
jgi:hypothetical protein